MADGYLPANLQNAASMSYEALLFCKTNIAGYFFDGFININISTETNITENPVETGVSVADHAYIKPTEINMVVVMSDVHQSIVPNQFSGNYSRSVKAYEILREIQNKRIPVTVFCRLGIFENMIIKKVSAEDNESTYRALRANVSLVELPIARVKTVQITPASQTVLGTEMGKISAIEANSKENMSLLYMMFGGG